MAIRQRPALDLDLEPTAAVDLRKRTLGNKTWVFSKGTAPFSLECDREHSHEELSSCFR